MTYVPVIFFGCSPRVSLLEERPGTDPRVVLGASNPPWLLGGRGSTEGLLLLRLEVQALINCPIRLVHECVCPQEVVNVNRLDPQRSQFDQEVRNFQ